MACLGMLAHPVAAQDNHIGVFLFDGNPYDRIFIRNIGDCDTITGTLTLDFTTSAGQVVIDTQYGGVGTQDPMPVEVENGPLSIAPVSDGDRVLQIGIDGLLAGQSGTITLDFDNEAAGWRAARVSIIGDHVAGAAARFDIAGTSARAVFDRTGAARIDLPDDACALPQQPFATVPMG